MKFLRPLSKGGFALAVTCALITPAVPAQSEEASFEAVNDPALIEAQRVHFNESLARLGFPQTVRACKMVVRLLPLDRNSSFGAICQLDGPQPRDILLCDDTMVGKFTLKGWGFGESILNVAAFTQTNCPKGG
ncbi:hypothetical protein [Dyella terrae]|uniref:hypothetical protein n=1 Tax=Dyella terrae TaxID=522259 RepID=UPI001EFC3691|nr:hypothetical protein [Dyella terrae]